ncbi:nitrous oxide reductase accessory protein NosL [Lysinibacillus parviboronicapiens]|uniref:nitrous oxide reductase accessory protein NosL n=1 Tax=Lysinibacillus parviboronicapiens TaxID=436516 RepID=UPI000D33FBE0|nr:nitrous oxide reductase accessory protein NosL [Lysinibacillus parviboronicapiens]
MKKLWIPVLAVLLLLGACSMEKSQVKEDEAQREVTAKASQTKDSSVQVASLVDSRLQEPKEDTVCEMCNMKVYMKDHDMGVFSTQAIKKDGTVAFYDDIGCLLNAEVANEETNEKFVRDYKTKEWAKVEDVTIVKTELKSPMNWGYIYFSDKADADKYIVENPKAYVEELHKIKDDALERRKKKMQEKATNGDADSMHMEEMTQEKGHDHNH